MNGKRLNPAWLNGKASNSLVSSLTLMAGTGVVVFVALYVVPQWTVGGRRVGQADDDDNSVVSCYEKLIGNTQMVRLSRLSRLLRRSIFVKMESLNPGGTGKDRAARNMIISAETSNQLPTVVGNGGFRIFNQWGLNSNQNKRRVVPDDIMDKVIQDAGRRSRTGGVVVEGTSGSTGISLAIMARSRGHACIVVLPDDQSMEKKLILESLGAIVHVVPTASIANPNHYVNVARRVANRARTVFNLQAVFINQFENQANLEVHYETTGPEILQACPTLSAFVMSAGTGGTIAGAGKYIKEKTDGNVQIVLVDPPGSSLYNKIEHGVAYAPQQAEQRLKRHRYDTIAEGIGLDRITSNFSVGEPFIDKAIRVSDQDAVDMAHWLLANEGLFVGSSSAMNVVGAVETAKGLPEDSVVVTVICDNGQRHVTRFWNRDFCLSWGLAWPGDDPQNHLPKCLRVATSEI